MLSLQEHLGDIGGQDASLQHPRRRCRPPARPGARWRVEGVVVHPETDSPLVEILGAEDRRIFRPLSIPPLSDPDPEGIGAEALRAVIVPWVAETLAPAVGARLPSPAVLVLEVVYPDGEQDTWTLQVGGGSARLSRGEASEPDLRNQIAASDLVAVIARRSPWGRALLSGRLRSAGALYTVGPDGLEAVRAPPFFLYLAISYAEATAHWVERAVARCLARR
ncbi:MAG: hypothetical protein ACI8S6_001492 [Myxococcota bacterium]